jgi:endonuclease/exonuclease/phosphatase family metal-dependent hydrolase
MPLRARIRACHHARQLAITLAGLGLLWPSLAAPRTIKLATWNLEWFMTPEAFQTLAGHCTAADQARDWKQRSIPCDVAAGQERSATDIAAMAGYAQRLDADVVALQEADGPAAARQLFPSYEFCFTGGGEVQNTGFAVRRGLPFRCGPDLVPLSLGDRVRRGATLVLYPGTGLELHLLAVHLKSGCARLPLDAPERACESLLRQAPPLRAWLEEETRIGHRYAVLGDFNRDLAAELHATRAGESGATSLWGRISGGSGVSLVNTAQYAPFHNCYAGQPHTGYIDYILLGDRLAKSLVGGSFERLSYSAADAWRLKLSDHCPVAIQLRLD